MYKCVQLCVDNSYFMLNFQHDGGGGLYDNLMSTRIFTLMRNKIFVGALKLMKPNDCEHDLDLLIIFH